MLRRYCDRCAAEMTSAACTFRFEFDRPQWNEDTQGSGAGRSIHARRPRVECDLCPLCLEAFTDWFTEFDDPDEWPAPAHLEPSTDAPAAELGSPSPRAL